MSFYRDVLGFEVTFRGPAPEDEFFGVVRREGAIIMFKALGVISDGDLRRWMEKTEQTGENLLAKKARDIMTKKPKVIGKDALAAEAVAVMESRSITCLLVPDADFRPEGVIHLHDLLKAGVV